MTAEWEMRNETEPKCEIVRLKGLAGSAKVLKPYEVIPKAFRGVPAEQPESPRQQLLERKLVRDHDAVMLYATSSVHAGKRGKMCGIVGDDGPTLSGGKGKLIGIGESNSASVLGGKNVESPVGKNSC